MRPPGSSIELDLGKVIAMVSRDFMITQNCFFLKLFYDVRKCQTSVVFQNVLFCKDQQMYAGLNLKPLTNCCCRDLVRA
jgi:hypothetical protein